MNSRRLMLGRIADVAARLERKSTDDLASYDLKEALQSLTQAFVDYRVRSRTAAWRINGDLARLIALTSPETLVTWTSVGARSPA